METKTEIFEADDSKIQNIKIEEIYFVTETEEKIYGDLNNDGEVKSEICEINCFNSPTQSQIEELNIGTEVDEPSIINENKIQEVYIKQEFNAEFVIKEDDKQDSQYDLFNQTGPGRNSAANKNDSTATVSKSTHNQELLQNTNIIKCKKCPKIYSSKEYLKKHQRFHIKKSHICDICKKSFKTSAHLKKHKYVHSGKKPYVCDVCQKAFNRINNLNTHKRIHSGERPYLCDVCQKTFNRLGHFNTHKLLHTGEKPHVCDVCQKAFYRTDMLRRHKLTHSGDKLHACDACQKVFGRKDHLRQHKRTKCGVLMP